MVKILDTTLREGEQTPGVFFDEHIKFALAKAIDSVGVDIIEVGHPIVSESIYNSIKSIAQRRDINAIIGAHSRSLFEDVDLAIECGVKFIGIFYNVTNNRLEQVYRKDLKEAVKKISDVIKYIKSKDSSIMVRYTPEDAVRSELRNVYYAAESAVESGADIISIADTTGLMVPHSHNNMLDYIANLKYYFSSKGLHPEVAVHCHNDRGTALANALDAIEGGADIVDASVMGLGERAGIVDLAQLITILYERKLIDTSKYDLSKIMDLYTIVSDYINVPIPLNYPITGKNAFTHCAGVHTHSASINPIHYQSLDPNLFNRNMEVSLDHMSGLTSIKYYLKFLGLDSDDYIQNELLHIVKKIGEKGRTVSMDEFIHLYEWLKK
jgi:2-isopropylmalate synthase